MINFCIKFLSQSVLFICLSAFTQLYPICDRDDFINFAAEQLLSDNLKILKNFFVPQPKEQKDLVKNVLLGLTYAENESIDAALFRLNDLELARALCQAHERGVKIRLVLDWSAFGDKSNKIEMVEQAGIPVYKYAAPGTMHLKVFIFYKNLWDKKIVWTGSANATRSGLTLNEENVIVTDHAEFVHEFNNRFTYLINKVQEQHDAKLTAYAKQHKPYLSGFVPNVPYQKVQTFLRNSWKTILKLATRVH